MGDVPRTKTVHVEVEVPRGWVEGTLEPPSLDATPEVRVLAWEAWAPAAGAAPELVAGCLAGETPWWTPEAEPAILARLRAVVASTSLRMIGAGGARVAASRSDGVATSEELVGEGDAEGRLEARTFLGFAKVRGEGAGESLVGCFALCAPDVAACGAAARDASVDATFVPAPRPTLGVRVVVALAHHPDGALASALGVAVLAGVLAVATRRRPRRK